MNRIRVYKNHIIIEEEEKKVLLEDLFTNELYSNLSIIADRFIGNIDEINEIYINRIIPMYAYYYFINRYKIQDIRFIGTEKKVKSYFRDALEMNQKLARKGVLRKIRTLVNILLGYLTILLTYFYLFIISFLTRKNTKKESCETMAIVRTVSAKAKINKVDNIRVIDANNFGSEFYGKIPIISRQKLLFQSLKYSVKGLYEIYKYGNNSLGYFGTLCLVSYYSKRILHKEYYGQTLKKILQIYCVKEFITGNNLDRFALVEESVSSALGIKLICIPHGIEYGFKLPHCFIGDIFYATSDYSRKFLNELYSTKKFIYNRDVVFKMFEVKNNELTEGESKIVFFTEPRDVQVNKKIIEDLIHSLSKNSIKLYLKLHPKDIKKNYNIFLNDIIIIEEYNVAISNNICISRKSTILIEALYNSSIPVSILINEKDTAMFNLFPSFKTDSIKVFKSTKKLIEWLIIKKKGDQNEG